DHPGNGVLIARLVGVLRRGDACRAAGAETPSGSARHVFWERAGERPGRRRDETETDQAPSSRSSAAPGVTGGVTDGVAFVPESRKERLSGLNALILLKVLEFGSGGRDRTYDQLINSQLLYR